MKTASKAKDRDRRRKPFLSGTFAACAVLVVVTCAYAADPIPAPVAPPASPVADPLASMPAPSSPTASNAEIKKNITAMENKVTDNAKDISKSIDSSPEAMNLEDLNNARQVVARIDALIDIEKHLADLEKARSDRAGGHAANSLANAIPASALQPLPAFKPSEPLKTADLNAERPAALRIVTDAPEISRIFGTQGQYSAVLKIGNETKTVRVGDSIGAGRVVRAIGPTSVVLDDKGQTHTLHIKNVDALFSALR